MCLPVNYQNELKGVTCMDLSVDDILSEITYFQVCFLHRIQYDCAERDAKFSRQFLMHIYPTGHDYNIF